MPSSQQSDPQLANNKPSTDNLPTTYQGNVKSEWIDYNGHMSEAFYVLVFGYATDELYEQLGVGSDYRNEHQSSVYTVEAHINYLLEVAENEPLTVTTQLLEAGDKKLRFCHRMIHSETQEELAFTELLALYVNTDSGRTQPFPSGIKTQIDIQLVQHLKLDTPNLVQRKVGQR